METNFPPLSDYLTVEEVYEYYRFCFVWGVRAQYGRLGIKTTIGKAVEFSGSGFSFELTNQNIIDALMSSADYLLNNSNIDDTTRQYLIKLIRDKKLENATIQEIADVIAEDDSLGYSDYRSLTIANTETCRAMGQGNYQGMVQNGVQTKYWVTAGSHPCEICQANEDEGSIPVDQAFSSGDMYEPAHPNDECYTQADEINLDNIDIWGGE
jgi:hypothetical protein